LEEEPETVKMESLRVEDGCERFGATMKLHAGAPAQWCAGIEAREEG